MPARNTRFLIDTNLFVAAVKSGKTKSTELLVRLIEVWSITDAIKKLLRRCYRFMD